MEENQIEEELEKSKELEGKPELKDVNKNKEAGDKLNDKEIEQNKEFKENARDKIMTELFLENFIIDVSDILIIVVGKLTYSEQLLINKIKVECKKQNKDRIFIIHNLQEFRLVEQVEKYIEETLLKCSTFNLNKKTWISTKKDKAKTEDEVKKEKEEDKNDIEVKKDNNIQLDLNLNNDIINNHNEENEIYLENNKNVEIKNHDDIIKEIPKKNNIIINNIKENEINENIINDNPINENINNENIIIENDKNKDIIKEDKNEIIKNKKEIEIINKTRPETNNVHFTEILCNGNKKVEIFHLIMAQEDSEAGKYYNQYACDFIESVYNILSNPKKFDVFETVKESFKKLSTSIINDNIEKALFTENDDIF